MSDKKSYGQILKSSSIMGGAASFVMVFSFVRTKFAAILIGTTGVGLLAGFAAIQGLVTTLSGWGLGNSSVREIAAAAAKEDKTSIGQAVLTLRRLSWLMGLLGLAFLFACSPIISRLTFGSDEYVLDIAALGFAVLFSNLNAAQLAVLQGMRCVGDMAKANIYGTLGGAFVAIMCYYMLGVRGVAPSLVAITLMQFTSAHYFVRKISIGCPTQTWRQTLSHGKTMGHLGFSLMWSNLLVSGVGYLTIYLINQIESVESSALYSAAFVLSGAFVGFVLTAMGADYYPRLTSVVTDTAAMRRLVNQQTEIGLLLALPGLLACILFAPWLIKALYTEQFMPAVPLLQWFVLGCLGRVISFPLAFVILAMGKGRWYLLSETSFNLFHACMVVIGLMLFGIEGVAIAFFLIYAGYTLATYLISKHLIGFNWDANAAQLVIVALGLLVAALLVARALPQEELIWVGFITVFITSLICFRTLLKKIGSEHRVVQVLLKVPGAKLIVSKH